MSSATLATLALFSGPIAAIFGSILTVRVMRKGNSQMTAVSNREASTNEFSALTEGFTESFRQMKLQMQELQQRVTDLEKDKEKLMAVAAKDLKEKAQILEHLIEVEKLVPNPPGPPPRPWKTF